MASIKNSDDHRVAFCACMAVIMICMTIFGIVEKIYQCDCDQPCCQTSEGE